jgi:hypothetical protein
MPPPKAKSGLGCQETARQGSGWASSALKRSRQATASAGDGNCDVQAGGLRLIAAYRPGRDIAPRSGQRLSQSKSHKVDRATGRCWSGRARTNLRPNAPTRASEHRA